MCVPGMKKNEPVHADVHKRAFVLDVIPLIPDIELDTFAVF